MKEGSVIFPRYLLAGSYNERVTSCGRPPVRPACWRCRARDPLVLLQKGSEGTELP